MFKLFLAIFLKLIFCKISVKKCWRGFYMVFYHCFAFFYPVDVATSNKMNKKMESFYGSLVKGLSLCSDTATFLVRIQGDLPIFIEFSGTSHPE